VGKTCRGTSPELRNHGTIEAAAEGCRGKVGKALAEMQPLKGKEKWDCLWRRVENV